jgi:hypothetical protein
MTRLGAIAALGIAWLVTAQGIAFAAAGDLDSSFDRNGKRVINSRDAVANVALAQPNGKIVVAGYAIQDQTGLVARLRPNGALDQAFGAGSSTSPSSSSG